MSAEEPPAQGVPDLPATGWTVLGMLAWREEVSGYDLKKWADWSIGHFYWSPSFSQVYSELKRIEALGFATSRMVRVDGARGRRVYTITDAGQAAVERWARTAPVDRPVLKHGVVLRVWMGHLNAPERLKEYLEEYLEDLRRVRATVQSDGRLAGLEPAWAYPRITVRWAERYYAAEEELTRALLADIDEAARNLAPALDEQGRLRPPPAGRWREVAALAGEDGAAGPGDPGSGDPGA